MRGKDVFARWSGPKQHEVKKSQMQIMDLQMRAPAPAPALASTPAPSLSPSPTSTPSPHPHPQICWNQQAGPKTWSRVSGHFNFTARFPWAGGPCASPHSSIHQIRSAQRDFYILHRGGAGPTAVSQTHTPHRVMQFEFPIEPIAFHCLLTYAHCQTLLARRGHEAVPCVVKPAGLINYLSPT